MFEPMRNLLRRRHPHEQPQQQQQQPQPPQFQQQPQEPQRVPPASTRAIKQLPRIRVSPEDLVDPNNRECCVCLEDNKLDDLVTRLPCAHIFHTCCIVDWLANHSCTCPVCRYELPTDDPRYEAGRIQRMKSRKPRFAMHELKRMPISDLLELSRPQSGLHVLEKKDLIKRLIDENWIDIIPSPDPVEYKLEELKSMKIGQLKRAMADAGVFFRREDVVEKSDMITVFENSGRLVLIRSESESEPEAEEESKIDLDDNNYETTTNATIDNDELNSVGSSCNSNMETGSTTDSEGEDDNNIVVETVNDDPSDRAFAANETVDEDFDGSRIEMFPNRNEELVEESRESETRDTSSSSSINEEFPDSDESQNSSANGTDIRSDTQAQELVPMDVVVDDDDDLSAIVDLIDANTDIRSTFEHYTIHHLQTLGRDLQVDLSHCLMRKEMIDLFVNAGITGTTDPSALRPLMFSSWSVSQLRVVASAIKINLSECKTKDEMIERILHSGNVERPYLRDYLRSLSPLTTKSLSDLRAIARELQINISDCLEKDEIIQRLIARDRRVEIN